MIFAGQRSRCLTAVFLAGLLAAAVPLGGCGYTLVSTQDLIQMNLTTMQELEQTELEEEVETEPSQEQALEEQLLSVLNLNAQDGSKVTASSSLDQVGTLFLDLALDGLENQQGTESIESELNGLSTVQASNTYTFIYEGTLSSSQVGKNVLTRMEEVKKKNDLSAISAVSVSYGSRGKYSVWLILAQYSS